MGILALLAVFTGEAAGETGVPFAVVYAAFLALMGWHWYASASSIGSSAPSSCGSQRSTSAA